MWIRSWWGCGLVGAAALSVATARKLVLAAPRLLAGDFRWDDGAGLFLAVAAMGFLCGVVAWVGHKLSRRLGMAGDAVTGMAVMLVFFTACMLLSDPELLGRKLRRGGLPMLVAGAVIGFAMGAWVGRDLRKRA